jgi:filamentous hemagglutinin
MNKNIFRLVFGRLRGMLVAVAETATATGKADSGETSGHRSARRISLFSMRHAAFAALMLFGAVPSLVDP